jgi:two-component system response regulator (stage 0 sporulation protein F)
MPAKRILLVDDQREITRLLRSALETLGRGDVIVETPSGEEALLEFGRGGADLLVIDVRLPGISGLDVVRRVRRTNTRAPVILISGLPDPQMENEARSLGVLAFMRKPININAFLPVAERALEEGGPLESSLPSDDQPVVSQRLSTLRGDLGANAVFLVDMQGRITHRAGDITRIDLDPVMAEVVTVMMASLRTSQLLGGLIPSNVHFFDGDDFDLYAANVGQFYSLVVIFDGERGAGQMGPVMRYGRQCADDLLNSLVMLGTRPESAVTFRPTPAPARPAVVAPAKPAPKPPPPAPRAARPAAPEPPPPTPPVMALPEPRPVPKVEEKPLTEADLQALDAALAKVKTADANSFWDNLGEVADDDAGTLSWDEAEKQGLVQKNE